MLRDRKLKFPNAANTRLKVFRAVFTWGLEAEPDIVKSNPARDVSYLRVTGDGYHSWSIEEVEQFEERHAVGTRARLALALLLYTARRRSDIIRFGEPMVKGEWMSFRQWKNRNRNPVDLSLPIIPELRRIIRSTHLVGTTTWLVTEFGNPYTAAGFGNRFRDWCNQAGLPHCSAHGLRKATAARLAELGCSDRHIMAITGHQTAAEVDRYTRGARQRKMAEAAATHLGR
ncbi:tyrosine-type recombinase/integrase [Hyphomicrobium sp.]|uniref:tyrosine-type recombinase/integrase n=1 Tax=Hyphomicrobium sp. TaxID=82 RepID=UPI002FE13E47